eukprot:c3017_g1_i1.p1 GENE.c3017_g1_i1~~c3017_g1_i1.p1  ORF type:complete len:131 (-),score=28.49 c3017_g1_i1:43-381(-)
MSNIKFLMIDNFTIYRTFPPQTKLSEVKAKLVSSWPAEKLPAPQPAALRIIYGGRVLDNEYLLEAGNNWVTMHLSPIPNALASQSVTKPVQPAPKQQPPLQQQGQGQCCTIL